MYLGQLLISYWWILIILIVVIALATKSVLKSIMSIFVIGAVVTVLWQVLIAPGFTKITKCFTDEAASPLSTERESFCQQDSANYVRLTQCFAQSQQENSLSYFLYSNMPKFKNTIAETIQTHNELCPESQLK